MAEFDITRVAGNIGAMNALNALSNINKQLSVHQSRLATGKRINSAADDPAGLTIATKLLSRSEGLKVALSNIGDAKNLLAVAESGMGRVNDILVQMRNKAQAAASDTMGQAERDTIVNQLKAFAAQVDDIASQTEWNGTELINGTLSSLSFQTGADRDDVTDVSGLGNMGATGAGSLLLADKVPVARSASIVSDGVILSAATAGAAANAYLTELATGNYVVEVDWGTDGSDAVVHLFDQNGNEMMVAQNIIDGSGAIAKGVAVALNSSPDTINFGNGLSVVLTGVAGDDEATVSYTKAGTEYSLQFTDATLGALTLSRTSTAEQFRAYMDYIGSKLDIVSTQMSKLGALTGRLSFKEDQVSAAQINVEGAYNRIMNANMAEEQVNASKYIILQQTATAMLAQANAAPQFLLSLFR